MLRRIANFFVAVMERWMPDPFLFAAILTMVTFILALIFTDSGPLAVTLMWGNGLWGLLVFTMQISITLVLSTAFIRTKPITGFLRWMSSFAKNPHLAYLITAFMGGVFSLISWACGLVAGAFVAKEMAKNVKGCHYPLLVASGYSGFMIWHMGYSSSVGLVIATPKHFLESIMGVVPVSQTIFAPFNMITALFLLITIPFLMAALKPEEKGIREIEPSLLDNPEDAATAIAAVKKTPADAMETSRLINLIIGIGGLITLVMYYGKGGSLTMDSMNLSFFTFAILLSRNPRELIRNIVEGGKSLGPIVLQFPMYAGIMAIMLNSGLAKVIAGWFVAISTPITLPFWSFISSGLVNVFVPSGGSQWAVQGPIMIDAARQMGVEYPKIAMAVAWGDQWTNMIQPFWALPMLAIAGMKAKDIMGYCVMALIWGGIVMGLAITFL